MRPLCPLCKRELFPVLQESHSVLNSDQFDALKAGDYYCTSCPTNGRGNTGYRYFWKRELAPSASKTLVCKYRKKPVVVEAVDWHEMSRPEFEAWCPEAIVKQDEALWPYVLIKTKEGVMKAEIGDYVIKGGQGEFYPCKPDIFAATYDEVEARETF